MYDNNNSNNNNWDLDHDHSGNVDCKQVYLVDVYSHKAIKKVNSSNSKLTKVLET